MNIRLALFRWMYFVCGFSNTESYIGRTFLEYLLSWYDLASLMPPAPMVFKLNADGSTGEYLGKWINGEIVPL